MTRITFALSVLAVVLLAAGPSLGADANVVGTWDVTFSDTPVGEISCELAVTKGGGGLAGTLGCREMAKFEVSDAKVDGNDLSFSFLARATPVTVTTEVEGDKLTGTWATGGSSGAFTGKRK